MNASTPLDLFPPTRSAALARLADFVPRAGRAYAAERNADPGPGLKSNVSMLSPYLRHRVLTEQEVLAAVLEQHSPSKAEKFIQEVFWRTYWKGWLQLRPSVWHDFLCERDTERERVEANTDLAHALNEAISGRTGIECFDDWVRELVETGYLHNHARMWFASIWIFTLKLPWSLGADFFLSHLLDGDPASNTLGWRWVAGIQTRGKTYLARPDNIEKYTGGRYRPTGLAQRAEPVRDETPPSKEQLARPAEFSGERDALLLVHGDDLSAHHLLQPDWTIKSVVVASGGHVHHPWPFGAKARSFVAAVAADADERLHDHFECPIETTGQFDVGELVALADASGVKHVLTSEPPVGPLADGLKYLEAQLENHGIKIIRLRRGWDQRAWPYATKGFFPFKKQIPALLEQAGLASS